MWWGGFSEFVAEAGKELEQSLNPHVVGRFFRAVLNKVLPKAYGGLNPHVVGRFFRVNLVASLKLSEEVLIPMWWGGFSEMRLVK